jgi:hypothetical protein
MSQMAEHNFAVGVEMTMSCVVNNYLRWFELHKQKKAIRPTAFTSGQWRHWLRSLGTSKRSSDWNLQAALPAGGADGLDGKAHSDQERSIAHTNNEPNRIVLSYAKTTKHPENGEMDQRTPLPEVHL